MKAFWNNVVLQVLQQLADLMLLNLVWLVFFLPLLTAGSAAAAMFTVADSIREGGGVRVLHTFLDSFRRNFRRCLVPTLLVMAGVALLVVDFFLARYFNDMFRAILFGTLISLSLLLCLAVCHLFPLLAVTEETWRVLLPRAIAMGAGRPARTLLIVFLHVCPLIVAVGSPQLFLHGIPLWGCIYFSGVSYVTARLLKKDLHFPADDGERRMA